MTIRTATGLIAWFMRKAGFRGWASFWHTIYVLPGFENDQRLLFSIKYLYWLAKFGYNGDHPYEVEARKAEMDDLTGKVFGKRTVLQRVEKLQAANGLICVGAFAVKRMLFAEARFAPENPTSATHYLYVKDS